MAKTLAERLTAAKSPRARLADNEALLADLKAEADRLSRSRDEAAEQSIDFALSESDREEAAARAARQERTLKGLEIETAALESLIAERRDSEAAANIEAERAAARDERDTLASEFAERIPSLVADLVDLFARVKANEQRLIAAGDRDGCAEAKARGVASFLDPYGLKPFTKMVIPGFTGPERAWPPIERMDLALFDYGAAIEAARAQREADTERRRAAAEQYRRDHGNYKLTTQLAGYDPAHIPAKLREMASSLPLVVSNGWPWTGEMPHSVAKELQKVPNLQVIALPEGAKK